MAVGARAVFSARPMHVLRYVDVALVLIAAVPALLLGVPALGYGVGGGAWVLQRALAAAELRMLGRLEDPRRWLGARLAAPFGRIWLLAGGIVAAGVLGGRADGLTAAIVIFCAYTIAFAIRVGSGPPAHPEEDRPSREGRS